MDRDSDHCAGRRHHACPPSRRQFVTMLSAAGAGCVLGVRSAPGQGVAGGGQWIIDTHHHIYPPRYTSANLKRIVEDSGALPSTAYTNWSPTLALEQMDKAGVPRRWCR